jgi:hypothetical protein
MGWLRVAGIGRSPDGATVTWSVAEGRRGRRWREAVSRDGAVVHSLLLELAPDGRFAHLELTTEAGLLTLHPEGDGTLHGNAVTQAGITHVRGLPWQPDDVILIEGSVVCRAVAGQWQLARELDGLGAVRVEADLSLARERATDAAAPVDGRGLPVLEESREWPLEEP